MTQIFEIAGRVAARTAYKPEFVAAVKEIQGRRWDADNKVWTVAKDQEAELIAVVEKFFGTVAKTDTAPAPVASFNNAETKPFSDFGGDAEAYGWYIEKRIFDYYNALPNKSYVTVSWYAVNQNGTCFSSGDESKPYKFEVVFAREMDFKRARGHYVSKLEKADIARNVVLDMGEEAYI